MTEQQLDPLKVGDLVTWPNLPVGATWDDSNGRESDRIFEKTSDTQYHLMGSPLPPVTAHPATTSGDNVYMIASLPDEHDTRFDAPTAEMLQTDFDTLVDALAHEAAERQWCSEWDEFVAFINKRLTVTAIPERPREHRADIVIRLSIDAGANGKTEAIAAAMVRDFEHQLGPYEVVQRPSAEVTFPNRN